MTQSIHEHLAELRCHLPETLEPVRFRLNGLDYAKLNPLPTGWPLFYMGVEVARPLFGREPEHPILEVRLKLKPCPTCGKT